MPKKPNDHPGPSADKSSAIHAYLAACAPNSRRVLAKSLDTAAQVLGRDRVDDVEWHSLKPQHLRLIRDSLIGNLSPRTVNRVLSAIRGVMRVEAQWGRVSGKELVEIETVQNVPVRDVELGRLVKREDMEKLIRTCMNDRSAFGARDGAMISLIYTCGLRPKEAARLMASQVHLSKEPILWSGRPLGGKLTLRESTGPILLLDSVGYALQDWFSVRGRDVGPLFTPIRRSGEVIGERRLTPQAISTIVRRRASKARIRRVTPRDLRATFAFDAIKSGADFVEVASILGYKSLDRVIALLAGNATQTETPFVPLKDYLHDQAPMFYSPYTRVRSRWAGAAERIRKRRGRPRKSGQ